MVKTINMTIIFLFICNFVYAEGLHPQLIANLENNNVLIKKIKVSTDPLEKGYNYLLKSDKKRANNILIYQSKKYIFDDMGHLDTVYSMQPNHNNIIILTFKNYDLDTLSFFFKQKNSQNDKDFYLFKFQSGKFVSGAWDDEMTHGLSGRGKWEEIDMFGVKKCIPDYKNQFCDQWQIFKDYPKIGKSVIFRTPTDDKNFFKAFGLNREKMLRLLPLPEPMKDLPAFQ
ncbi:MAG: hypothetical protein J6562_06895 [Candidatus Schmidhempelia sp.]|nr:hypothetical protein [Candidatus Schmidhempelia sp.]